MGFVKTPEELDRYYALGVRRFENAKMMGVMFSSSAEKTAPLLPPPLEQADMPGGLIFIAEYPETNLGPGYHEAALFVRCKYQGEPGAYCLSMPIDNEARNYNGRDIFGFPKKLASIHYEKDGNQLHGWVERNGVRFVEIKGELNATLPQLPPTGPTYLFKGMPRIDLTPGFDGPVYLAAQKTELDLVNCEVGTASVTFQESETDPWHELDGLNVMLAFHIVSHNTMLPGKILQEVDGEAFLPHYFKMTDFFAGKRGE